MIPKEWEGKDFYQVLGIMRDARMEDIKAAHRRLVRAFHPDLAPSADSAEKFRAVTLAYEVLGNPKLRAQYDEYYFTDTRENSALYTKRKPFMRLLVRVIIFILILLLLKNLGYLGNTTIIQNSGSNLTTNSGNSNNNQVLALMAGPQGPPGPAGVAGRDGFIGLNGYQGKDGLPGAPGAVGEQGPIGPSGAQGIQGIQGVQGAQGIQGIQGLQGQNVTVETIGTDEDDCDGLGGVRLIGTTTAIVCNGSGGGGGGAGVFGTGYVNVGTCDSNVKISLESAFRNGEFKMSAIIIDEIAGVCNGQELKAILKVRNPFPSDGLTRNNYSAGDSIQCSLILSLNPNSGANANSVALTSPDCENTTTNNAAFRFYDVYAEDVSSDSRGLLIQIAAKP
jgi:hypothetical protein